MLSPEQILQNARESVTSSLACVDSEIEQILTHAQERGKKRAEEEGADLLRKQQLFRTNRIQELRVEILHSAIAVARIVLKKEIQSSPDIVLQVALRALCIVPEAKSVSLRVNPDDVAFLKSRKECLLERLERTRDVDVRADRTVLRGGLIIQTESGIVDAQIDTQLEEIAIALGV